MDGWMGKWLDVGECVCQGGISDFVCVCVSKIYMRTIHTYFRSISYTALLAAFIF